LFNQTQNQKKTRLIIPGQTIYFFNKPLFKHMNYNLYFAFIGKNIKPEGIDSTMHL